MVGYWVALLPHGEKALVQIPACFFLCSLHVRFLHVWFCSDSHTKNMLQKLIGYSKLSLAVFVWPLDKC